MQQQLIDEWKTCSRCNVEQPIHEFSAPRGWRKKVCRSCLSRASGHEPAAHSLTARRAMKEQGVKPCTVCKKVLARTEFYSNRSMADKLTPRCKDCTRAYMRDRYRAKNGLALQRQRDYGITLEEQDRLWTSQSGQCAICKCRLGNGRGKMDSCIDHCHGTGAVRGILCRSCNIGLGKFEDDPERLRAAASYLERATKA